MASAKGSGSVRGAVTDPSAPPFASRNGKPTVADSGKSPAIDSYGRSTNAPVVRGVDFTATGTSGETPDAEDRQPTDWGNPGQIPGGAATRVDSSSIPSDGIFAPLQAGNAARERDPGPQPSSVPFKNMK